MTAREFDKLVERALRSIAPRFRKRLHNVAIVVEAEPPRPGLLGLYHGRPLTRRNVSDSFAMPDVITIYQGPHERLARDSAELEQMVRDTVWHEIAHYFGMDERQVRTAEQRRDRLRRLKNPLVLLALAVTAAADDRIDALFQACREPGAPGASVLAVRDGKVLHKKAYGLADTDAGASASTATNYRLASVTKQFTAMAVMMLHDRGLLTFEDKLGDLLPGLPDWSRAVTVRHLLNHTSGIRAYEDDVPKVAPEKLTPGDQVKDKDVLEIVRKHSSTYFEPGSQYRYSNSGYALLALIVEKRSGLSFAHFLRQSIFAPLGMNATVAYENGVSTVPHRAYGHARVDGRWVRRDQSTTSAVLGDGGIYSSVDDLARWDQALADGRLVKADTWKQAVTPAVLSGGTPTQYGFGWEISAVDGKPAWRHSGGTIGFANHILRLPEQRLTVIVLCNRTDLEPRQTAERIAALLLR